MILWGWTVRKLSAWVVGAMLLTVSLLVAVEGLEQAGTSGDWWGSVQTRLPLLLRDLLGLTLVFAAAGLTLRARARDLQGLSAAGVSPGRVWRAMLGGLLIVNLLLGAALEGWIHQRSVSPGPGWVHGESSSLFVSNGATEEPAAWSLHQIDGDWTKQEVGVEAEDLRALWSSRTPAEQSLVQLGSVESTVAKAWYQWRLFNLVLPALLAGFAVGFILQTSRGVGWSLGLPLGLTLATQIAGSIGAQAGQPPWLSLVVFSLAGLGLLAWGRRAHSE